VDYGGQTSTDGTPLRPVDARWLDSVTLGEGNTPVIELPSVGETLGLNSLHAKLEYLNPTGSFKDRGTAVVMAAAKQHGAAEVVEDSSGNAGASVSAYAARAGIKAHIFAPANAPEAKLRQIRAYGAQVHAIEGTREAVTEAALAFHHEHTVMYASHVLSPYFAEGTKIFAYEVFEEFGAELPMHIVIPVGNGSLLLGAWRGFSELKDGGSINYIPRLHAVQASGVRPLVAAFNAEDEPANNGTIAGGIAVGSPARKAQIVEALHAANGEAIAVSDAGILRWHAAIAEREGVFGEPTSAAAFAGVERLVAQGTIGPWDSVLVPVTGFGLKDVPELG